MSWRDAIANTIIKVFHSSPHDFPKFDYSKIGVGEGNQAFGHGLYFAENPKVSGQGGQYYNQFMKRFSGPEYSAAAALQHMGFDREKAAAAMERMAGEYAMAPTDVAPDIAQGRRELAQGYTSAADLLRSGAIVGPRTYEVGIHADPVRFLNWDASLLRQPDIFQRLHPEVRNAIDDMLDAKGMNTMSDAPEAYSGASLYKALKHSDVYDTLPDVPGSSWSEGPVPTPASHASAYLNSLGVPGIRFLDQGSRLSPDAQRVLDMHPSREAAIDYANSKVDTATSDWVQGLMGSHRYWAEIAQDLQKPLTSNYVTFADTPVEILKKYGVVGAPAGAVLGGLAAQDQYEAPQ